MVRERVLIDSWRGAGLYFFILVVYFGCFFFLTDHAEYLFAENYDAVDPDGLLIKEKDPRWPLDASLGAWLALAAFSIAPVLANKIGMRRGRKFAISLAVGTFIVISVVFLGAGIGITYVPSDSIWPSPLLVLGSLNVLFAILVTSHVFTSPVIPESIRTTDGDTEINRYMANKWRFAQASLSIGFAAFVGALIPFAMDITKNFGTLTLITSLFVILLPFMLFSGFKAWQIHLIELDNRP